MDKRSYGQFCGLTRGADLLGGRWTLPIVRDLLLGPARFGDLAAGFPGISTNQLTTRLKELEATGVIRRTLGANRAIHYELTDWGRELEPVVIAIGRWGALRMEAPAEGEIVTEAVLATMLRTGFAGRSEDAPDRPTVFEVFGSDLVAHAAVRGDQIEVASGGHAAPDIRIPAGPGFRALVAGRITADEYAATPGVEISGDASLLPLFTRLFCVPLRDAA